MRKVRLVILALCSAVVFDSAETIALAEQTDLLIGERSMGRVGLGMQERDVLSRYSTGSIRKTALLQEGYEQPAMEILDGKGAVLLTAEIRHDRIFRTRTMNPQLLTKSGLRVGQSFGDAKRRYGDPALTLDEDGLLAVYALQGATLVLRFLPEPEWHPRYLTETTSIVEILLVDPALAR